MRCAFTQDQKQFRHVFRELLEQACTADHLRTAWSDDTGRVPGLWGRFAEFGVLGALAPEEHGGLELTEIDLMPLLEEAGRAGVPEPLMETSAVAMPLLVSSSDHALAAKMLARVIGGDARVTVALGGQPYVTGWADTLLLEHEGEAHLVERTAVDLVEQRSVDRSRRLFRVLFDPTSATAIATGDRACTLLADAEDRGVLGTAAQLVGLGARLVGMTVEYVKQRKQFGRPVGAFQAVKHAIVDAHLATEFARPLVHRAAYSMAHRLSDRSVHVSMAKAYASDAALRVSRIALQMHGAMGYSYEYDLHLFLKRAWALARAWGDASHHRNRVSNHILGGN